MNGETGLSDLLAEWEELSALGRDVSAAELCASCPELAAALAEQIDALRRMRWLNHPSAAADRSGPPSEESTRRGGPGKVGSVVLALGAEPLPGYRLLKKVGCGGFGEVWAARSASFGLVAMKFCHGGLDAPTERRRVGIELGGLSRIRQLSHPHLLTIYHMEVKDGATLILVTELAEDSLERRFKEVRDERVLEHRCAYALHLLRDAAEALDYLQTECGLMHFDVKPSNLLLVGGRCKVGDFGTVSPMRSGEQLRGEVALLRPSAAAQDEIATVHYRSIQEIPAAAALCRGVTLFSAAVAITPYYAPPEALLGKATRSFDQYSLALTFCELVTGHIPFREKGHHCDRDRLHGKLDLRDVPAVLHPVLQKALSPRPQKRFDSCMGFVLALRNALRPLVRGDKQAKQWLAEWPIPGEEGPAAGGQPIDPIVAAELRARRKRRKTWKGKTATRGRGLLSWCFAPFALLDRLGGVAVRWWRARRKRNGAELELLFRVALLVSLCAAVPGVHKLWVDRIRPLFAPAWGQEDKRNVPPDIVKPAAAQRPAG